jgi:hypothetical protein
MRFTWDEPRNRSNLQKHGISFDTATQVFLDPLHISRQDRMAKGEERWQTIGHGEWRFARSGCQHRSC